MLYQKYDHNENNPGKYDKRPVSIYLFCHDDIDDGYRSIIYRDYLKAFMYELEQVFQRNIIVELHYAIPGFTDMTYYSQVGQEPNTLDEVSRRSIDYAHANDLGFGRTHRYGLITRGEFSSALQGLGGVGGSYFMASLAGYQSIAHELGHTFTARHEDAEVSFGIPPSQTYMHETNNPFYAKSYRFSETNRQHMANFLSFAE